MNDLDTTGGVAAGLKRLLGFTALAAALVVGGLGAALAVIINTL